MIRFIALSGFLGAGKTTTMMTAAQQLRAMGHRVAVVTNDQGSSLVDTALLAGRLEGVGEVTGGCFCCRFEDLLLVVQRLVDQQNADVIIAESVGSCTDLTATVLRPLAARYGGQFQLAPITTIVDPLRYLRLAGGLDAEDLGSDAGSDIAYLFRKQLEDAAVIVVNKADLLAADEAADVVASLCQRFPHGEVLTCSAAQGELGALLEVWARNRAPDDRNLEIDYARYGRAEAGLAWLNQTVELRCLKRSFVPAAWVATLLDSIAITCREHSYTIGHVKIMFADPSGSVTKASLVDSDRSATVDLAGPGSAIGGTATINARVECEPAELEDMTLSAVHAADAAHGVTSLPADQRSFKPGQPVPTHRILAGPG